MKHNWYAVITAKILMAKDLSSTQKLLVALISNLSNEKGYCYATNAYLGECLDVSPITISQNITDLENKGYVGRVMYLKNNIEQRFLTVNEKPIDPPLKINTPLMENNDTPPIENHNHNNKVINNKSIEERLTAFQQQLEPFISEYGEKMIKEFYKYWIEMNDGGKKMRFEMEKIFNTKMRLERWDRNNQKFNKYPKKEETNMIKLPDGTMIDKKEYSKMFG
jgi:hypothetical protein